MRTNGIGKHISTMLDGREMEAAFEGFRAECDHLDTCPYSDNVNNCVVLCLLPKLIHLSLGATNSGIDGRIESIRTDMQSVAKRAFCTIRNTTELAVVD